MNIVIDARMLTWTGIGRYTTHLLEQLQQFDHQNNYSVLLAPKDFKTWEPSADNFRKILSDAHPYGPAGQSRLRRQLKSLQPDLVHFTHFTVPLGYRGRYVVTIYDFTLLDYKNIRGNGSLPRLKYGMRYRVMKPIVNGAIKRAAKVITLTEYVAGQLRERYHLPAERIVVIPAGAQDNQGIKPIAPAVVTKPLILYVGNAYPFKNLERLVEAFGLLSRPDYSLVLVGKKEYFYGQLEERARAKNTIFAGFVSDSELAWLYQNATAYVFPSLSEGFGLPGLEAMAHGLPVISSNASCLPEVYGDAAHYFDPYDAQDMAKKIGEVLDNADLRKRLKRAGLDRIKRFSWKRMAEQTLKTYQEVTA